jgi:hypothetical protein
MPRLSISLDIASNPLSFLYDTTALVRRLLFSNNEPGFLTTISPEFCFADTAGTTPATIGGTVGLVLDRSQGLVLGPELVTNGTFDTDTGWTLGTGWAIADGVATKVAGTADFARFTFAAPLTTAKTYIVQFDVVRSSTSGTIFPRFGGGTTVNGSTVSGSGTFRTALVAASGNGRIEFVPNSTFAGTIDNISVRELPGNHWTQATSASRPILGRKPVGGRRNLLTRTEEFDNAAWQKTRSSISANVAVAPDGTMTADKLIEDTSANSHFIQTPSPAPTASGDVTVSCFAKADTRNIFLIVTQDAANVFRNAFFDVSEGQVLSVASGLTALIEPFGNGWFRCSVSQVQPSSGAIRMFPSLAAVDGSPIYQGDGTSGLFIWGAQIELGSTATPYQRVTTAFDVTEAGKANRHYLYGGGSADPRWMITPTITPGTDKVQVFAGLRKLSDAGGFGAVFAEMSTDSALNNGAIGVFAPVASTTAYGFRSRGTAAFSPIASGTLPAPSTNVLTGLGDISGDLATLRIDGAEVAASTADQGTGNFLAYPAYIGARGGVSLFFTGEIYSLITRFGPNLTATELERVEAYVANLTPDLVAASEVTWNDSTDTYTQNLVGLGV